MTVPSPREVGEQSITDLLVAVATPAAYEDSPTRKAAWDEIKRRYAALVARCEQLKRERDGQGHVHRPVLSEFHDEGSPLYECAVCGEVDVASPDAARAAELEAALAEAGHAARRIDQIAAEGSCSPDDYEAITDETRKIAALASPPDSQHVHLPVLSEYHDEGSPLYECADCGTVDIPAENERTESTYRGLCGRTGCGPDCGVCA